MSCANSPARTWRTSRLRTASLLSTNFPRQQPEKFRNMFCAVSAAQNIFLNFSGCCLGKFVDKSDAVRSLEVRQVRAGEFAQLIFSRGGVAFEHYKSVRRLAPALVRQADDRDFL